MSTHASKTRRRYLILTGAIIVTALITMSITALLINIMERKSEVTDHFANVVNIDENVVDPAEWGKNFPLQYESYLKTSEMGATTHGGSVKESRQPDDKDPRTEVAKSRIEEDPRLKEMWSGYAFAVDYREARGHQYMLDDQRKTKRVTEFKQPGTCLNCHASTVKLMNDLGDGDANEGFKKMNKMSYKEVTQLVEHPVACIDCHDPKTMQLRITRPAFANGIRDLKASQGVKDFDVNRDATHEEMRSYVCGQCHVEYYFKGEDKTLTFPWAKGIEIDQIWDYYKEDGHVDFVNTKTGADIVKAQHPEFDVWSNSIHAQNGVSCSDCHMPYERHGAKKVSSHHLQSPLLNINNSCMTCHNSSDKEMEQRVVQIQDRFIHSRDQAFDSLTALIKDLEKAKDDPATPEDRLKLAREYQNKASFYLDYVYSENSNGFHAPDYIQRIISDSLDASRKGQLVLQGVDLKTLEPSSVTQKNKEAAQSRGH
ncbi:MULTISPECIES: ammonia-forming cytochrome c nitrite reductase subunit c552 [Corynebacterium]|uniref:nitrite reductase (cytochrome; ammonia-forming) n=3 Tax=Corynebacterium TaxID=1716 RepID=A0ABD0BLC6_CORUL|nr:MULTISPECIES: ammonia-forming cytochrome c nitrite reductase subunit c552 [Corynebacterium]AEG82454.1 putative secreted protein [Corynebacterium ulcerans 809]AIU31314.1 Nitrite reductase periplasmic cytochrome c552 [Corynebacterium ulcerans]AIU33493.1 Nitrite reductase periplasmic cytochrome c552 [Corynebacterium ramonii FRC0011]AIU92581.1 Nitrite reductase periplasmic cytochrome c552 [Corynebacterium ulcerans]AKN77929.1 Nitrite reductase periplasmic cytochrome c552 [Corynebacterium ulceran